MDRFFATVGTSEEGILNAQASHLAQIQVHLVGRSERRRATDEVADGLKAAVASVPGLKARVNFIGIFGTADDTPIFIEMKGQKLEDIVKVAAEVEARTAQVPGTADVKSSWEEGRPEVRVELDREKAAQMGLTLGEVALALRTALEGEVATQFRDGETEVDARVIVRKLDRSSVADVGRMTFLNHRGQQGVREALLEAGPARLRPIVMTTLTLVLGRLPLALSLGPGTEMRSGMAVVLIGGLITSTLLTLVLVPVVYTILEEIRVRRPARFGRKAEATVRAPAAAAD